MISRIPIYSGSLCGLLVFWSLMAPPTLVRGDSQKEDTLLGRAFEMTGLLLHRCLDKRISEGWMLVDCLKRRTLVALDRIQAIDHLLIYDGVELVKKYNETILRDRHHSYKNFSPAESWLRQIKEKLGNIFETHTLKLHLKPTALIQEARRRHHHHMMPLLMFGTLAISMIAIPLGFQFLAVLGGKALLLAKLALILTSIQGLKRIATSNLNYGLYQAPQPGPCKETPLNCIFPDDNSFDITLGNEDFHFYYIFDDANPFDIGHGYDRKWNYEFKEDPYRHVGYDQPDSVLDLLHPMSPRSTSGYEPPTEGI